MKKKTKLLIALLLVFVGVGLTYAVYTTSVGGNANVESANWVIKVKVNNTETDVSNGSNNVELGSCEKLAPGGSCTLPFRVDATDTEVDTVLTVELGSNVTGATLSELEAAGINLRISDGVNEDYAYLLNMGTYKNLNLVINWEAGDEDDDVKAAADVYIANNISEITIPVNMIVKQRLGGTRTVTFNTHDSNIETPESIQVNDGETISNIPSLSKNGYIFVGWFTSENGGVQLTSSTPIIENIEYHARFREPQNVTVSFNTHGGSNVNSVNVLEGGTLSELPSAPTKLGYTFAGWYTAETGGEQVTTSTVINNTIEFHAQWTIKYVTVTFNSNGGNAVSSQQVQEGASLESVPTCTGGDGEFIGWYDSNDQLLTTSTQIMGNITYTARWRNPYVNAGNVVYYNPVSASTCSTYNLDEIKAGTNTCYKWYIISENSTNTTMMLDHNLVNKTVWNESSSSASASIGPTKVLTDLATETSSWDSSLLLRNYSYSTPQYTISCNNNGECTIGNNPTPVTLKARLITKEEVTSITSNNSWLLDNTMDNAGSGAVANKYNGGTNNGYWMMTNNGAANAYEVNQAGLSGLYSAPTYYTNAFGARPVITVATSSLN